MQYSFILNRIAYGSNLGSTARAMKTMGFSDLRLVQPQAEICGPKSLALAKHATDILEGAKIYPELSKALAGFDFILGSSHRHRRIEKPVIDSHELYSWLDKRAGGKEIKTAMLFGPESTGLSLDELSLCDAIVTVPTKYSQPSLNLAQAVMVIAYELSKGLSLPAKPTKNPKLQSIENSEASFLVLRAKLEKKIEELDLNPERYLNALSHIDPKHFYLLHDLLKKI